MIRLSGILLLAIFFGTTGCSSQWTAKSSPQARTYSAPTDQIERTVGKLRRLLLLPVIIQTKDCPKTPTDDQLSKTLQAAVGPYLANWKGYEVVEWEDTDQLEPQLLLRLGDGQTKKGKENFPLETERKALMALVAEAQIDGILVIKGDLKCLNAIDVLLYFMIVGMPNWAHKISGKNLSAGIYSAHDGRLVWLSYIHVLPPAVGGGSASAYWANSLFREIENAVPEVLLER
ncbi:MAG TPA: hypothetical protein VIR78_00485 [Malonomonas sp.]